MALEWLKGGLTRVPGVRVGQVEHPEGPTGVTVALFDLPAPGGVDVRGGASGTRQFGALDPTHVAGRVHGVCFAGGSAFGLEAGTGALRYLEARGVGLPVLPGRVVPVVPTAIVFDLGVAGSRVRPDAALAEAACAAAATGPVAEGSVGAGAGATVGKCAGHERAMKGGVGSAVARMPDGHHVGALVVVNAFGDVLDPATHRPLAGVRAGPRSRRCVGSEKVLLERGSLRRYDAGVDDVVPQNTTLALVATDLPLTRVELTQVARLAGHGLVRSIRPVHTAVDGDLVIAVNTAGEERGFDGLVPDATIVGLAAAEAVARAVVRGVRRAKGLPGIPGLADR